MVRTIRARATLTAVCVVGAGAVVASVALVLLLHQSLVRNLDTRVMLRLEDLAALAQRGRLPPALAGSDEDGTVAQVIVQGRVVAESPVVRPGRPLADFIPAPGHLTVRTVRRPPIGSAAASYRVAARSVTTSAGPGVVYAAGSLEPVNDSLNALEALLLVVVPGLVALVGLTVWWLVGRTLGPVDAIRRQVAEISGGDLHRRVPEPGTGDEIHRLAGTMNEMLARLEQAAARQRIFVSDAAHELRSPLATIRTELETTSAHLDRAEWPAVIDRLSSTSRRMERLVEDLLVLATAEEQGEGQRAKVDLDELVLRQLLPLRATSRLRLDLDGLGAARVWGNADQLERLVANLVDNAERHAATTITVELRTTGDEAELVVADDGPGIAAEGRARIFDRFSRLDRARDRRSGGTGLGLAIARRIVEGHSGIIEVGDADAGTRMIVRLPLSPPDSASRVVHSVNR
jgi:signal transduction histidine kinase